MVASALRGATMAVPAAPPESPVSGAPFGGGVGV